MAARSPRPAALKRGGAEPLHAQIARWLRDDIRDHRREPGTALPSEAQLGERFGVARSVVRQALASLVAEGIIVRQPGRAPMVAQPRRHHRLVQRSTGMFDQFARAGVTLRTRVLRIERRRPPPEVAAFFGTRDLLLLERLRHVDDEPLALVDTWLPAALAEHVPADALADASLHAQLQKSAGLAPGRGRNQISAVAASADLAQALAVAPGSPLLLLEGQGRDQHDRPLEYFFTWHRADRLVFDVDVTGDEERVLQRLPKAAGAAPEAGTDGALARAERLLAELAGEIARLRAGGG